MPGFIVGWYGSRAMMGRGPGRMGKQREEEICMLRKNIFMKRISISRYRCHVVAFNASDMAKISHRKDGFRGMDVLLRVPHKA